MTRQYLPADAGALRGKIVEDLASTDNGLAIFFEDGFYTYLRALSGRDGCGPELQSTVPGDIELLAIGLLTQKEFDAKMRDRKRQLAYLEEMQMRAQYEKLKKRFEGG